MIVREIPGIGEKTGAELAGAARTSNAALEKAGLQRVQASERQSTQSSIA